MNKGDQEKKGSKRSLSKSKISSICNELFMHIEKLLAYFDIDYVEFPNRIAFPCPVHGGDNPEACCIFTDGLTQKGNWSCWTHHCEEEYVNNLFGFVRGCLSINQNKSATMNETADFCLNFLNKDFDDLIDAPSSVLRTVDIFNKSIKRKQGDVSRTQIRERINIPSDYYIRRGYEIETLEKFDVGECKADNQPMSGRVIVPIYDEENNYVGCVGRAIKEHIKPKWLHSQGFKKDVLYGLNLAKEEIMNTGVVVLVEGQGDVWRLHEAGISNAVGIFGCSINEDQLVLLEKSGAMKIIILTDYDEAGQKASQQIIKKCGRRFNYIRPEMNIKAKDVGDLTVEQIKTLILPQIKGLAV